MAFEWTLYPSWHSTDLKRLNVVEIMSVYGKTLIQRQNNVEHQMVEMVLLTHYGFNIEIEIKFELYVKSTLFLQP